MNLQIDMRNYTQISLERGLPKSYSEASVLGAEQCDRTEVEVDALGPSTYGIARKGQ